MTWRSASCTARPNRLSWEAVPQLRRSPPPHQPRGVAVIREPSRSEARSRPGRAAATLGISPRMAGRWRWLPTRARARPRPGDWNSPNRELLAGQRFREWGGTVNLSAAEWFDRWRKYREQGEGGGKSN